MNWLEINPTLSGPPRALTAPVGIYDQISIAAQSRAHDTAIVHGETSITYGELIERVQALRHQLVSQGIYPNSAIIVQLPRSIDYIVSVLAILAHDSHFVPVAETEPQKRVEQIIYRVDARAQVTLSPTSQLTVSHLSGSTEQKLDASQLAYIMHTSGSTGSPKGAALSVTALSNLLSWYGEELSLTPDSRFAQLSRPSFDFSIPEVFLPLMYGGQMIIPPRPIASGLIPAAEYLIEHKVTVLQLVPTLLRPLVSLLDAVPTMASRLRSVATIVCNGESLPDPLRQGVARVLPVATLVNSYGPTEACVAVTWHRCSKEQRSLPNIVGRPAPNVDLYVLTDELEPVPAGAVGELWIGGVQVADGYAGSPHETQRSFIVREPSDSSSRVPNHVYRTGDLVRVLEDGNVEYVGRRDRQVKFRGVRVEISEIETAVRATNLCNEVRVVTLPGTAASSSETLLCYVTPTMIDMGELERQVHLALPSDRWPSRFITLATLPATANGKIDDAALQGIGLPSVHETPSSSSSFGHGLHETHSRSTTMTPEQAIREALAALTGRLPAAHEPLNGLGLDSMGRIQLQVALADRGYVLPQGVVFKQETTVGSAVAHMSRTGLAPAKASGKVRYQGTDIGALKRTFGQVLDQAREEDTDLLVVQSSLPDFKGVSLNDALSALLSEIDRVAQRVTIALPAYTLSFTSRRDIDLERDPSESGVTSSHVIRALGGLRTRHPVYSFAVIGPDAKLLAGIDWAKRSPFGNDSIFGWFSAKKTKYVLFGTRALAHVHRCEYMAQVPYMSFTYVEGLIRDDEGTRRGGAQVYARDIPETIDERVLAVDIDRIFALGQDAAIAQDLGVCESVIIDTQAIEQKLIPVLQSEPYSLLKAEMRGQARALVQDRSDPERF
jgi:amino acid adenylation domain-containing protein